MKVGIKGAPPLLDEALSKACLPDESTWELDNVDGQRRIVLTLMKKTPFERWGQIWHKDATRMTPADQRAIEEAEDLELFPELAAANVAAALNFGNVQSADADEATFLPGDAKEPLGEKVLR